MKQTFIVSLQMDRWIQLLDNSDEINVVRSFAKLQHLKSANGAGIVESIKDALESIGIGDIFQKLVGF